MYQKALHQGAWILTPHKHLSHTLLHTYAKNQPNITTPKAEVLPIQTFITLCYEKCLQQYPDCPHPLLLNNVQANLLWEKACYNTAIDPQLAPVTFQTYIRCQTWGIPTQHPDFQKTEATRAFATIASVFTALLKTHHALIESQIVPYLENFSIRFPTTHIILVCFDELNPQQLALQRYLQKQGITVQVFDWPTISTTAYRMEAKDEKEEETALIQWIENQAAFPVGIIVPTLNQTAHRLKRLLTSAFGEKKLYFSLGEPLSQYPLVDHALCGLRFLEDLDAQQTLLRLNSSFWTPRSSPRGFEPCIFKEFGYITSYPIKASPKAWVTHWTQRLIELGFPGTTPLNSMTYQCYERFLGVFILFQTTTFLQPSITFDTAFTQLKHLCQQTLFQPEQDLNAPIHVLGLLEAAGQTFENSWVMQATEKNLPPPLLPTPFVPLSLQRAHYFPQSDFQQEWRLMRKRLDKIQSTSKTVIFSYAKTIAGETMSPSMLLPDTIPFTRTTVPAKPLLDLESVVEPTHLPLLPQEIRTHGSYLLAEQAKCPFRAFASQRLHVKKIPISENEIQLKQRGIALHQTLEYFWKAIKTQENLKKLSAAALNQAIHQAVSKAIPLSTKLSVIEHQRLTQLLLTMSDWEKTRPPFQIEALEATTTYQLGPITFKLRMDRIDRLGDALWVIDYKTTLPSPLPWYSDAPLEPQILLYALTSPLIQAIVFYGLDKGKIEVKCLASTDNATHFEHLKTHWKTYLTQLATDFHHGACQAVPADPTLCQTCAYGGLCRVPLHG